MQTSVVSKDIVSILSRWEAAEFGLRGLEDDEVNVRVDKMVETLWSDLKARGEPVSAAEALAAFGMLRREYFRYLGEYESTFEDAMLALAEAVEAYLARAASSSKEVRPS